MDIALLRLCIEKAGKQELGIPIVLPSLGPHLETLFPWALQGSPVEGRQLWFGASNAKELFNKMPGEMRCRVFPLDSSRIQLALKRGPYDALLIPKHGFSYADPTLFLSSFWSSRGKYTVCDTFSAEDYSLWFWTSTLPKRKIFGMDHHHAVLWDAKKILRMLNVQLDFVWLCDGRKAVNEAIPCQIPHFLNSNYIYKTPVDEPLSEETKTFILEEKYDGVITSHSLVTTYRLQDLRLPMVHINSTRFGNEWIQDKENHTKLVSAIQTLLQTKRLLIVHNNLGDKRYFHQFIPYIHPTQELVIPSLCEGLFRIRNTCIRPMKILLWDTRQVLLRPEASPFMKHLYVKCKEKFGDAVESQAILMAQAKNYLPEGYLDDYTAVIHIPYNVSTMSMFEHARANIPIWVPSKRLLATLWADSQEPNELSWTVFKQGSEENGSALDKVRNPDVIEQWLSTADFYNPEILPLCSTFDTLDELFEKLFTTDYESMIQKAEATQQHRRESIIFSWEQVIHQFSCKA
jgi:hypothetical protein